MGKILLILSLWSWINIAQAEPHIKSNCGELGYKFFSALAQPHVLGPGKVTASLSWHELPDVWTVHRGNFVAVYLTLPNEERPHWNSFTIKVVARSSDDKTAKWEKSDSFVLYDKPSSSGRYVKDLHFPNHIAGPPEQWPRDVEIVVLKNEQPICSTKISIRRSGI